MIELGMIVKYDGKLAEIVSIAEGRTIGLQLVGEASCPTCNRPARVELLEHSPLFQDRVKAVTTID